MVDALVFQRDSSASLAFVGGQWVLARLRNGSGKAGVRGVWRMDVLQPNSCHQVLVHVQSML